MELERKYTALTFFSRAKSEKEKKSQKVKWSEGMEFPYQYSPCSLKIGTRQKEKQPKEVKLATE